MAAERGGGVLYGHAFLIAVPNIVLAPGFPLTSSSIYLTIFKTVYDYCMGRLQNCDTSGFCEHLIKCDEDSATSMSHPQVVIRQASIRTETR